MRQKLPIRKQFNMPAGRLFPGQHLWLDLGEVRDVAQVYLNGQDVRLSSFSPHVRDVAGVVREGENSLVIDVANIWLNRLAADAALPAAQRRTHTNLSGPAGGQRWLEGKPKPSGLLGPVRLLLHREVIASLEHP